MRGRFVPVVPMPPSRTDLPADPVDRRLREVARDRRTGAHALELRTLDALSLFLRSVPTRSSAEWNRRAGRVAARLATIQPGMGAFRQWADDWRRMATQPSDGGRRAAVRWVRRRRSQVRQEIPRLRRVARRRSLAGARIVTISRSASVADVLAALAGRPRLVLAAESRPGGEGREFARDLRRKGVSARWASDRRALAGVRRADALVLGADSVDADGSVVHKVGSRALALAAARSGVPVIVVAGRSKWVASARSRVRLPAWFDRTPGRLVTEYWTDRGVIPGPRAVRSRRAHPPPATAGAAR